MSVQYLKLLKKSWEQLKQNPIIVIPQLINLGLFLIVFLIALIQLAILGIAVTSLPDINFATIISNPYMTTLIILFVIFDGLMVLIANSFTLSIEIGMYEDIIKTGKAKTNKILKYGRIYFSRCFIISSVKSVLDLVPLLTIFYFLFKIPSTTWQRLELGALIVIIIPFIFYLLYCFLVSLAFFFTNPIIAFTDKTGFELVFASIKYFFMDPAHYVITVIIFLGIWIAVSTIFSVLLMPLDFVTKLLEPKGLLVIFWLFSIIKVIVQLIRYITSFIIGYVLNLFRFNAYYVKK